VTVPTTFVTCLLVKAGVFDGLASQLSGVGHYLPVPTAGLGIIAARFAYSLAAYVTAGGLLAVGEVTAKDIILSLLVGDVLTSIVSMFRYLTPYYVGIFGPATGLQLMLLSSAIQNAIVVAFIAGLALLW
nr:hypothetical protein [Dehalococcoidales bacterium]